MIEKIFQFKFNQLKHKSDLIFLFMFIFNKKVEKNLNNLSCEIKCIARATSMYVIDKEN